MKLRTRKSHLQKLPEEEAPQRLLPRLVRYLYILILLLIVLAICYAIFKRFFYYNGWGQVQREKVVLSSVHGGVVKTLYKKDGQLHARDEVLAIIDRRDDCIIEEKDSRLFKLIYDIEAGQAELGVLRGQLERLEEEVSGYVLNRALEIGDADSRRRLEDSRRHRRRLQEDVSLLKAEIYVMKEKKKALEKELQSFRPESCDYETVRAPVSGQIFHISRTPGEYVAKGEPFIILTPEKGDVVIEAFFDNDYLRYVSRGDTLNVHFPDKYESRGIVSSITSAAKPAPRTEREDYLPVKTRLRVLLVPPSEEARRRWGNYDRMDVRVSGERI